ncbi:MAG: Nif3-like dinuclear metal center hexameric protein [Candidatus Methylacidiphilales bacterium]
MTAVSLRKVVAYADRFLSLEDFTDYPGAINGLQVANGGRVSRIASSVDATERTINAAVEAKADLLVVHHGLGWQPLLPLDGAAYRKVKRALDFGLAIYSAHLPLDAHPTLGNNVLLARAIGLQRLRPAFMEKGMPIGQIGQTMLSREALAKRLAAVLGRDPLVIDGGPQHPRKVGIVSGGAGTRIVDAAREGIDTFITGEGSHWTDGVARDLGINLIYGGHYLTETFGVRALADHLSKKFRLAVPVHLDFPTGL